MTKWALKRQDSDCNNSNWLHNILQFSLIPTMLQSRILFPDTAIVLVSTELRLVEKVGTTSPRSWLLMSTSTQTFYIVVNDEQLCTALGDPNSGLVNPGTQASCSAVVHLNEGNLLNFFNNFTFRRASGHQYWLCIVDFFVREHDSWSTPQSSKNDFPRIGDCLQLEYNKPVF